MAVFAGAFIEAARVPAFAFFVVGFFVVSRVVERPSGQRPVGRSADRTDGMSAKLMGIPLQLHFGWTSSAYAKAGMGVALF